MQQLEVNIQCPHCWQAQTVFVDPSTQELRHRVDCQICCQPIEFDVCIEEGQISSLRVDEDWA